MEHNLNPVSPKLVTARYISAGIWLGIPFVVCVVLALVWSTWWWIGAGVTGALLLWLAWLIPAQVKLMGWLETEEELLLKKGKLWHTFTVVPYGRIQFVDVTAGPIENALGLKSVELHTASATSDSEISGLLAAEADALRDRLAVKARERMSGL